MKLGDCVMHATLHVIVTILHGKLCFIPLKYQPSSNFLWCLPSAYSVARPTL